MGAGMSFLSQNMNNKRHISKTLRGGGALLVCFISLTLYSAHLAAGDLVNASLETLRPLIPTVLMFSQYVRLTLQCILSPWLWTRMKDMGSERLSMSTNNGQSHAQDKKKKT